MTTRFRRSSCSRRLLAGLSAALAVLAVPIASRAAKWNDGCPHPPLRTYPSTLGAVTAPFVHPGHEIGIVLSQAELAKTGGFSTEPGGNTVNVVFASLFGDPVSLPGFAATAVTSATVYFEFPDAVALIGRPLAGPVHVTVLTGDRVTANISPSTLVALPPDNDIARLVEHHESREALATLDTKGSLWIPLQFRGMGISDMPMPTCPSEFIHIRKFAIGLNVRANLLAARPTAYPPLRSVRTIDVFLGDFVVHDDNMYGMLLSRPLRVLRTPGGPGISLCALNDAVKLVLRVRGQRRWAAPWSDFGAWMPNSTPLALTLSDVSAEPMFEMHMATTRSDTFGNACELP